MADSRLRKITASCNLAIDTRQQNSIPVIKSSIQGRIVIPREGWSEQGAEIQSGRMTFAIRRISRSHLGNDALERLTLFLARGSGARQIDA